MIPKVDLQGGLGRKFSSQDDKGRDGLARGCICTALVLEDDKRRFGRTRDTRLVDRAPARRVMMSGFGYLIVGMLAGWFHPIAATTFLVLTLVDCAADHHVAQAVEATSARANDRTSCGG